MKVVFLLINQADQVHVLRNERFTRKQCNGDVPEFLRPKLLQLLPKLSKRELGSIVLINFSIKVRTLWSRQPQLIEKQDSLLLDAELLGCRQERQNEGEEGSRKIRKEAALKCRMHDGDLCDDSRKRKVEVRRNAVAQLPTSACGTWAVWITKRQSGSPSSSRCARTHASDAPANVCYSHKMILRLV